LPLPLPLALATGFLQSSNFTEHNFAEKQICTVPPSSEVSLKGGTQRIPAHQLSCGQVLSAVAFMLIVFPEVSPEAKKSGIS